MSSRQIKLKANETVKPCPKCGNNMSFTIKSVQVCEDGCEVWAECKCGYDPAEQDAPGNRLESVMGGCDDDNCYAALEVWNDSIEAIEKRKIKENKP